jgi:hypothetical protein
MMLPQQQVAQVKEQAKGDLLSLPNVVGVGVGYKTVGEVKTGEMSIVVMVRRKLPAAALPAEALAPKQVGEVSVDVLQVGDIRAQQSRTDRVRPAPGGVSIGHYLITAGTFGCVVRDQATNARLILSNNHVLANSNAAAVGDAILQPGPVDGGRPANDTIATLERFCPIDFGSQPGVCSLAQAYASLGNTIAALLGSQHRLDVSRYNPQATNLVDAAVARPLNDGDILDEIMDIGVVQGTLEATLAMPLRKSGRTTGFTTGQVLVLDATIDVSYGVGKTARFENQIVAGAMSQGGDSGSLVVHGSELKAVGLLFAGSDQSTVINPIQAVLNCLQVSI